MPAKDHTVARKRPENGKRMNNAKNIRKNGTIVKSWLAPADVFFVVKARFLVLEDVCVYVRL